MSDEQPRASSIKVGLAVLAVPVLTVYGCSLFATEGAGHSGRGPWELTAVSAFAFAGALAFYCYSLAFKKSPSFVIHADRLHYFQWKKPIYFKDVEAVELLPADFWAKRGSEVNLRLRDGTVQYIPTAFMTHGAEEFATLLEEALERYRAADPPLS